jgi:undecaprenyl diphosphate synthase
LKTTSFSDSTKGHPESATDRLPKHIAIIMDGNGRWAKARGQARVQGHRRGVEAARTATTLCGDAGIPYLTLFAFSSENWKRPDEEVRFLTQLLALSLEKELDRLDDNDVKLNVIGEVGSFGGTIERTIEIAQEKTASNRAMTLTIALNYGSRRELATAARNLAQSCIEGRLRPEEIDESHLDRSLDTYGVPDPDLLIRTGGEVRLSNFLLWQLAYTELIFSDVLWPDFDKAVFDEAISTYQSRQRRFGRTGDQIASQT